jgi:aryl-alcohol dehydrogenase-like predicted oxidoreductase
VTHEPKLALGTAQFGLPYGLSGNDRPVTESEVREILRFASSCGVERLDTAAAYGDIEQRLGFLIGDLPFNVVSKIPAISPEISEQAALNFVKRAITRSHCRLGGLLTGILFHRIDDIISERGQRIWDTAQEQCRQLGIALGVSGYDATDVLELSERLRIEMVQVPGNAFDQRVNRLAGTPRSFEITIRSVFLQGLLLMPQESAVDRLPAAAEAIGKWQTWCAQRAMRPLDGAIAVCKALSDAHFCVIGVDSVRQFEEVVITWSSSAPCLAPELEQTALEIIDPRYWHYGQS